MTSISRIRHYKNERTNEPATGMMEVRWKTFTFQDQFLPKIKEVESCPKCFADFSYVFNLCEDPRHGVYVQKFYNLNDFIVFTL